MSQNMLRFAICCTVAAMGTTGCGDTSKNQPEGWETTEFTEPAPETPDTEVDPDVEPDPDPENNTTPDPVDLAPHGAPCTADEQCSGGVCLQGDEWTDGYCTTDSCSGSCDSPDAGCVDSDLGNFCAEYCENSSDCREGYGCQSQAGSPRPVCVPSSGGADGGACTGDADCLGGTCLADWHEGFCTTTGCDTFEDCASPGGENNRCLRTRRGNFCVRMCQSNSECRDGYVCEPIGGGDGMCYPDPAVPFEDDAIENNPFQMTCEATASNSVTINYDIAPNTTSYLITPIARDGRQVYPARIDLANAETLDFQGANQFQAIPAYLYGGMNPTVVPAVPQFESQLASGPNSYLINTDSAEVCHYLIEESGDGNKIDMNIYFVGVPGLDASSAANDPDMQEVLTQFNDIWGPAGFTTGTVRYFDITGTDRDAYRILRDDTDVEELVALSQRPGNSMDDVLSINIFFTEAFAMGGAIGISMGLPGPAGLHGTHGSGVAFTSEYFGVAEVQSRDGAVDGNIFTGQILAHEVGHYLGLFHTTEDYGQGADPLADTPQCSQSQLSGNCPDVENLMFPYAGASHVNLTADQAFVLAKNPLTKGGAQ